MFRNEKNSVTTQNNYLRIENNLSKLTANNFLWKINNIQNSVCIGYKG